MLIEFTVLGRAIPAVRMTQRSKFAKPAQRYIAYKNQVGWTAKQHFKDKPTSEPVAVNIKVFLSGGNQGDVDNYFKSITDSLNKIIYNDDRQVRLMTAEKIECKKDEERVEVKVYELKPYHSIGMRHK